MGKEGPSAQIGVGIASAIAGLLRFDHIDLNKLAICSNVPILSFISGIIAYQVAAAVGIKYMHHRIEFVPIFQGAVFLEVIAAGILAGICAVVLVELLPWDTG